MTSIWRKWWIYPIILIGVVLVVFTVFSSSSDAVDVTLGHFISDVKAGDVKTVEVHGDKAEYKVVGNKTTYSTDIEAGDSVRQILADNGIEPDSPNYPAIKNSSRVSSVLNLLITFVPILFIVGILFVFLRQSMTMQRRWPFSMTVSNFDPVCRTSVNPGSSAGSSINRARRPENKSR